MSREELTTDPISDWPNVINAIVTYNSAVDDGEDSWRSCSNPRFRLDSD